MAELYVRVDLTTPPSKPQVIPETVGEEVTGVVVNGPLPAGLTFKVSRTNSPDGVVLGGATSPTGGGDALLDFFCPPIPPSQGLAVSWDIAAPGSFALLCVVTSGAGSVARS